jgi:hypothetical protein
MKMILIILLSILPFLLSSTCKKDKYRDVDGVKLMATLNDTSETIQLGDTIKISFNLPDLLITELGQNKLVNTLQQATFNIACARIDSSNVPSIYVSSPSSFFVTEGSNIGGNMYASNTNKPFRFILNIIPPIKGMYLLEVTPQPGKLDINKNEYYKLKVNFNVTNKHWNTLAYYYNVYFNANTTELINQFRQTDSEGYGIYGFRVI